MSHPGNGHTSEMHKGPCLESIQPTLFHQIVTELTETKRCLIVVELESKYHCDAGIGEARSVAIAVLHAEIYHAKEDEIEQIWCEEPRRRQQLTHYVHGCARVRITHQRQINE